MEGSENYNVEKIDDSSEKVEVKEVSPESVSKQDDPVAVEVIHAEEKETLEKSGSSEATQEEKEAEKLSGLSEPEAPVKEGLVSSENEQKQEENYASVDRVSAVPYGTEVRTLEETALPISDKKAVESSGVADSVCTENVVDSSEPIAIPPQLDRDLSENPCCSGNQPAAGLTSRTRSSWMNCCGLFDALRRSNQ